VSEGRLALPVVMGAASLPRARLAGDRARERHALLGKIDMRLNTRAFAIASAAVSSAAVFVLTILFLVGPGDPAGLRFLSGFLFGYAPSLPGAFVGALWAWPYGFLLGGIVAFLYNLALVPPPPLPDE